MKLKILVKLVEKLLGMTGNGEEPRADMYLPERLLAMAMVLMAGGTVLCVLFFLLHELWMILAGVAGFAIGVVAVLCWKNQSIRIISGNSFEYTTFLGNTYTYSFSDIRGLRKNSDSMTLLVGERKVHIESMAILSQRLIDAINQALQKNV